MSRNPTTTELSLIRASLAEEESYIQAAHFGGAGGSEVVQRRTGLIDRTLRDLWHARPADEAALQPALIAVGGYGRGELNPHSDIDIMLLCRDERQRELASPLLYLFWDAGLDIGYSVRTADECIDLARADSRIRTSLLESRLVAGDPGLFRSYQKRMQADVLRRRTAEYISEKIAERAAAKQKYGQSLYLREPNIKESSGGLRDVHLSKWIAMSRFDVADFGGLISSGVISPGEYAVFHRARNFLWRVRNELHYRSGRRNDQLTYDQQEMAAKDFKYRDSSHLLAVERFMKSYFLHARTISQFAHLVLERSLPKRERPWTARPRQDGAFTQMGKTLIPSREEQVAAQPALCMQAFETAQQKGLRMSGRLQELVRRCRLEEEDRRSPEASASLLRILNEPENLSQTMTAMRDLKYLGKYLPEFRKVQGLARHDYYHLYTVDEHILAALANLEQLWLGRYPALDDLAEAFHALKKRWVLMLAVLLHDLGKAYREDHEKHGKDIAACVMDRMGISGGDRERVLFLVEHHGVMSVLSQRRELNDAKVISDFAGTVGDRENLMMLYALTYADMSAVGPSAWTPWKAALLRELYARTLSYFSGQQAAPGGDAQRIADIGERLRAASQGRYPDERISAFLREMPRQYVLTTPAGTMLEHMGWLDRLPEERIIISRRNLFERGCTELTICAYDAYGMFYRTAGTIAAQNLSIRRAKVYTAHTGIMIDTFEITDANGAMLPHDDVWETVTDELRSVLTGGQRLSESRITACERHLPGTVSPEVTFDNATSASLTIIDITARDRVGLLYRVAKTLYDLNLDVASAKIHTEGIRVLDSFYVSDLLRMKIVDPFRLEQVSEALLKVLQ